MCMRMFLNTCTIYFCTDVALYYRHELVCMLCDRVANTDRVSTASVAVVRLYLYRRSLIELLKGSAVTPVFVACLSESVIAS